MTLTIHYGYILESGQIHPKIVSEMIDFDTTNIICLGLGNLSLEDKVEQYIKYDTEKSWTYQLPKEHLRKHAKDWYHSNEMLKKECPKYVDTSKNRKKTLQEMVESITRT